MRKTSRKILNILCCLILMICSFTGIKAEGEDTEKKTYILSQNIVCSDKTAYLITAEYDDSCDLPQEQIELSVKEVNASREYVEACSEALEIDASSIAFMKLFDICFVDPEGQEYQPTDSVSIRIEQNEDTEQPACDLREAQVIHFAEDDAVSKVETEATDTAVSFETDSFSVFAVTSTKTEETRTEATFVAGKLYEDDNIILSGSTPAGAIVEALPVYEIPVEDPLILAYDINIYANQDMKDLGIKWQPEEGSVTVTFKSDILADHETLALYHIGDEGKTTYESNVSVFDSTAQFNAYSFSVYALVETPNISTAGDLQTLDEFVPDKGYCLSAIVAGGNRYYLKNNLTSNNCIEKTANGAINDAALWRFEEAGGGLYKMYTLVDDEKVYVQARSDERVAFVGSENATPFELLSYDASTTGKFVVKVNGKNWYLNYSGSNKNFKFWHEKNSDCMFMFTDREGLDVFGLDGKSYGFLTKGTSLRGYAASVDNGELKPINVLYRTNPVNMNETVVVTEEKDIAIVTVHHAGNDRYKLSVKEGSKTYYLKVEEDTIVLTASAANATEFQVKRETAGGVTGLTFYSDGKVLYCNANQTYIMRAPTSSVNKIFRLIEPSILQNDDFVYRNAKLASISDTSRITNGSEVVIYTRIWNPDLLQYEFFIINHDGSLIPAIETGDELKWIGTKINTPKWKFTEYYYEGTNDPNYYYDFENVYSGKYLAPSIEGQSGLSDTPVGVNLNGRRYGDSYSTIIAWDDKYYNYAGLKIASDHLTSGVIGEAYDFYFAIVDEVADELRIVTPTINNDDYGIVMRMQDYGKKSSDIIRPAGVSTSKEQHKVIGNSNVSLGYVPVTGLLSTNLVDGYPVSVNTGRSLEELYSEAVPVNHFFPTINYTNSGYFQFDSANNYAYLDPETNDFTVYEDLGTSAAGTKETLQHGQFFPYNDLTPGKISDKKNRYDIFSAELPNDHPRKNEQLYRVDQPNYYYGMELSTTFVQTRKGVDAWGNDIIFEFSGDDDFWLYVDDELVIDLGGIHSALSGKVNFRTGVVNSHETVTTLKDVFESNYRSRNPEATDAEVEQYLDEIFSLSDEGNYVFKENTPHTMKMFYMERGAGAANLRMRFNITPIKPNEAIISKTVSGADSIDFSMSEFAYRILYSIDNENWMPLTPADGTVTYYNTSTPVKYMESYRPPGMTAAYDNVYFLKHGEKMSVMLPEYAKYFKVQECGINENIFEDVEVNGTSISGQAVSGESNRKDYTTPSHQLAKDPVAGFVNQVNPNALRELTIEKTLYDENDQELSAEDDDTTFNFRLYLASEGEEALTLAYLRDYHVKDEQNRYCLWNAEAQRFQATGHTTLAGLSEADKRPLTFKTSTNGAISKIPAGYKVVVDNLLVGTKFKVEERPNEIPVGYRFDEYRRVDGTYIVEDGDTPDTGTIRDNSDPVVNVVNHRGYGIVIDKKWSDEAFTRWHQDVYVALFHNGTVMPDTVRKLTHARPSVTYYFDSLQEKNLPDIEAKEVILTGDDITEDPAGNVTGYDSMTVVGEEDTVTLQAKDTDDALQDYPYSPEYSQEEPEGGSYNVQRKHISNIRPGIRIYKTDLEGNPLEKAVFEIIDDTDKVIGTFTSDADGLVTTAYLGLDRTYRLRETKAPTGYSILAPEIEFKQTEEDGIVILSDDLDEYVSADPSEMKITIKNKPYMLQAVKLDQTTGEPIQGVVFALYKDIAGLIDYVPMRDYAQLVTGSDGVIPHIDETLPGGIYYLREERAPDGYEKIQAPIKLMISPSGEVSVFSNDAAELEVQEDGSGTEYTLKVFNCKNLQHTVTVRKVVTGNSGNRYQKFGFTFNDQSFELADNESMDFLLDDGETITLTEEETDYITSFRVISDGDDDTSEFVISGTEITGTCSGDLEIIVTNDRTVLIPTEVPRGFSGLFLLLPAVFLIVIDRKIKNDE